MQQKSGWLRIHRSFHFAKFNCDVVFIGLRWTGSIPQNFRCIELFYFPAGAPDLNRKR